MCYFVYIMTNVRDTTLYIGVTNSLKRRTYEHSHKLIAGFTTKYNLTKVVYYEACQDVNDAIAREKQLKGWSRVKKNALIDSQNPDWQDLWDEIQ